MRFYLPVAAQPLTGVIHRTNVLYMNTTEARQNLTAAIAKRTHLVQIAETLTGRKATAAWKAVEVANWDVDFAAREVEMATRSEMVGATEAAIQTASRAA